MQQLILLLTSFLWISSFLDWILFDQDYYFDYSIMFIELSGYVNLPLNCPGPYMGCTIYGYYQQTILTAGAGGVRQIDTSFHLNHRTFCIFCHLCQKCMSIDVQ
jgi:hypothetical protein